MSSFDEEGFLSERIQEFELQHKIKFQDIFDLANAVNRQLHKEKFLLNFDPYNEQHVIVGPIFVRILNSYGFVVRLCQLGGCHDAQTLHRSMIEGLIYLNACAGFKEFTVSFIKSDDAFRLTLLNAAATKKKKFLGSILDTESDSLSAIHRTLKQRKEKYEFGAIPIETAASAAASNDLTDIYDTSYRFNSNEVHYTPRSLTRYVDIDEVEGRMRGLHSFVQTEYIPACLIESMSTLLRASKIMWTFFGVDCQHIDSLSLEVNKLGDKYLVVEKQ